MRDLQHVLPRRRPVAALVLTLAALGCGGDEAGKQQFPVFQPSAAGAASEAPSSGGGPAVDPTPEPPVVPDERVDEGPPPVTNLDPPDPPAETDPEPTEEVPPTVEPLPVSELPVECAPFANAGARDDGDINVDLATEFQTISGFGGINVPGWIADLTPEQTQAAFGRGPGEIGLSLLRVRVPFDSADFEREVPTAQLAVQLGARVMATPWTPPPNLKTNNDSVSGGLARANYGAYADHLLAFRDFMALSGVPLAAMSIQNEPDIRVDYESCDWTAAELSDFLVEQGPRFGDTRLIAAESFNFNRQMTDPLLQSPAAAAQFEIVGGHIYGSGLSDYPLARQAGKEVWMTEHYTDSNTSANAWPNALTVATEINDSMQANFNAYVWWYIRRSYGLLTEDGLVSKRGSVMSQYARFIRPGYVRVAASQPRAGVRVTAFKNGPGRVVVVAVNSTNTAQPVNLDVFGACVGAFERFTTSQNDSGADGGLVTLTNGRAAVTLDAQSVTTFSSQR